MEGISTPQGQASSSSYALVLFGLGLVLGILTIRARYQQKLEERDAGGGEMVVTSDFQRFQGKFMRVYLAALGTDWLQQAYLFVLLREYHQERFVVKMYLAGVASQLSLSVLLEVIGGFIPHKSRCATCLALQAGSAAFLVHPAYGGLVTSRVLGGFAAALLHSSFEAWMVEQHVGQGFPLDWFTHTFNKLSIAMSALAIVVGPVVVTAHDLGGGNLGPFKFSLAVVVLNGFQLIAWRRDANKACPTFADTARLASHAWARVVGGGQVSLIATAQGCFEGAIFGFALLWTPLLTAASALSTPPGAEAVEPPWGIAFSQQVACVMIGSVVFKLVMAFYAGVTAEKMCVWACLGGAVCFGGLALGLPLAGAQAALLGFEACVGVYLNAMGVMRSKYVPHEVRGLVLAVSKLVITTGLFVVLVFVSESRGISASLCSLMAAIAAFCSARAAAGDAVGARGDDGEDDEEATGSAQRR